MPVQDIVLEGFGSSGSVSLIVTRGYSSGAAAPVVPAVDRGGGIRRRKFTPPEYLPPEVRPTEKIPPPLVLEDVPEVEAPPRDETPPVLAQALARTATARKAFDAVPLPPKIMLAPAPETAPIVVPVPAPAVVDTAPEVENDDEQVFTMNDQLDREMHTELMQQIEAVRQVVSAYARKVLLRKHKRGRNA